MNAIEYVDKILDFAISKRMPTRLYQFWSSDKIQWWDKMWEEYNNTKGGAAVTFQFIDGSTENDIRTINYRGYEIVIINEDKL